MIENYFVCIGAQKSGTTWLAHMLAHHPDIFITPVKELHYFDTVHGQSHHLNPDRKRSRYRKYFQRMATQWRRFPDHQRQWGWWRHYMSTPMDDDWYARLFAPHFRTGARFAGEATPEYATLGTGALHHIKRLAPDARLLFIMRNPVNRAWSGLLHYGRRHNINPAALSGTALHELLDIPWLKTFGDYSQTLQDMYAVFPLDQIHIEYFELIHQDRFAALERICRFIGTGETSPAMFPAPERSVNRSQKQAMPDQVRAHFAKTCNAMVQQVNELAGPLPDHWRRDFPES